MPAEKKQYRNCTHCGSAQTQNLRTGFKVIHTEGKEVVDGVRVDLFTLHCKCGLVTRLCKSEDALKSIWNSRPKKPWVSDKPVITVGDLNTGMQRVKKQGGSPF